MSTRYYNPEVGRFINADAFATTGQGLLGNNMYAYCNNSPVVNCDSLGTRAVPAGRRLNEGAGKKYYDTPDDAAKAFAEKTYEASQYIRHEVGTEIYSKPINGKTKYTYSTPRVGSPHYVMVGYSTPPGTRYIGFAHIHPNSDDFSRKDKRYATKFGGCAYVVGPSKELKKTSFLFNKTKSLGVISPKPLTDSQRVALASAYIDSWEQHLVEGCDPGFACSEKIWPAE